MLVLSKDRLVVIPFAISMVLILIAIFIGFTNFVYVNGKLIINYGNSGSPILGDLGEISSIILIGSAIILINLFLIYVVYNRERFFAYALSFTNVLISALILATLIGIASFN